MTKKWWWLESHYWQADMALVMNNHLAFIERQKKETVSIFYGTPIQLTDGVYHPSEGSSTHLLASALMHLINPTTHLLEIGCGSGAISCVAAQLGASRVLASDISRTAYLCAQRNIVQLGLEAKVDVLISDLFSNVPKEKFDIIVFNPPLLHCAPMTHETIDKAEYNEMAIDHNGTKALSFIHQAKSYLKEGGRLLLLASNIGDRAVITRATEMLSEIGRVSIASAVYHNIGNEWRFVLSTQLEQN